MFKIGNFWHCYQTFLDEKNTNLDDNLYWRFYTRLRLSTGSGRQYRLAFIHKANVRYSGRRLEKVPTLLKRASAL